MIKFDNCKIEISGMGLFLSDSEWIHPERTEATYEIIYVVSGEVFIKEAETEHCLTRGNLIILKPHVCHRGFKASHGRTSFYWLHFYCDNFGALPISDRVFESFENSRLFKEILHRWVSKTNLMHCEILLSYILSELFDADTESIPKLAAEIFAWVHANASAKLSAKDVGTHFGYNSEHISRIIKSAYNCTLKALIDREIISSSNNPIFCLISIPNKH